MITFNSPTTKYKFTKKKSGVVSDVYNESPKKIQIVLSNEASLEDLLEAFEDFIVACGFSLRDNEKVAIIREVENEEEIQEDESDTDI